MNFFGDERGYKNWLKATPAAGAHQPGSSGTSQGDYPGHATTPMQLAGPPGKAAGGADVQPAAGALQPGMPSAPQPGSHGQTAAPAEPTLPAGRFTDGPGGRVVRLLYPETNSAANPANSATIGAARPDGSTGVV
eukprot:14068548-Alexandrium_andersonii.AAC.1